LKCKSVVSEVDLLWFVSKLVKGFRALERDLKPSRVVVFVNKKCAMNVNKVVLDVA
jgi:hypothetical protein